MRIVKANLVYRFSPYDGWTRQAVSQLFKEPDFSKVIPRYYDMEKDKSIFEQLERGWIMPEHLNDGEYQDCDYFAVYNDFMEIEPMKLSNHEIINPFASDHF